MKHNILITFVVCVLLVNSFMAIASNPTIMVVPFKQGNETYADVLSKDFDKRMAVDKVNEALREQGIEPIDLFAVIELTMKANAYEDGVTVDARDKQLLDQSGSDVFITVDLKKTSSSSGNGVSLSLKAYNRSTGAIMASKVGFSPKYRSTAYDKMCVLAVRQVIQGGFLDEINGKFEKAAEVGSSIMLRIALGESSGGTSEVFNLVQYQTPKGRLGDAIRSWLRSNAHEGNFHPKGSTAELIVYDNVQIPPMTSDGYKMYPDEFASNFINYLYTELGVTAEERIDGNTIYITVY